MIAYVQTVGTPDGPFTMLVDAQQRVLASGWTDNEDAILVRVPDTLRPARIESRPVDAAAAVAAYYRGDLGAIDDVPVRQVGTPLQQAGWQALRRIAPGRPLNYRDFATALGRPSAVRAAASVCARNAPALFVPCHRVLRADGTMGGFAWGTAVKASLLAREASA